MSKIIFSLGVLGGALAVALALYGAFELAALVMSQYRYAGLPPLGRP